MFNFCKPKKSIHTEEKASDTPIAKDESLESIPKITESVDSVAGDGVAGDGVADDGAADDGAADDGAADDGAADDGAADDGVANDGVADDGVADDSAANDGAVVSLDEVDFEDWLAEHLSENGSEKLQPTEKGVGEWTEIRLFLSSTFIDTQAERDKLIKVVIPEINRKMAPNFIRIIPVDLRWGVLAEETKSCCDIQKTCLNQIDNCRLDSKQTPWFLGLRTDRYGWVQGDMMASEGFENPEFYDWIDKLKHTDKKVSITSLEVCHATRNPDKLPAFPTVFFYKRQFTDAAKEQMEKGNFKWVFEFEYTDTEIEDPELKYQYTLISKAEAYRKDKQSLDDFLQGKQHVVYSDYPAGYGGKAFYTAKRENAKSFGVGYADELDEFANKVEHDLLTAIKMNFIGKDSGSIDPYLFDTIQHENAVKLKASTFVGRDKMVQDALDHINATDNKCTLILHGEPGCGKSGLLAAVAQSAAEKRENDSNFVFIHAVDSCPGSNLLEKFLRRLHVNLRAFRRFKGEIKVGSSPPESLTDLKQEHHSFIEETGAMYPICQFIFIVDAVNQFNESNRAWDMWWLMRTNCPNNVRFMISTLNEENNTFESAKISCPLAKTLEVTRMSKEDLVEMVSSNLERYNKKLTTYEDKLLGNQMDIILSKSSSPLFLIAASEALRKFGIFEKVSEYIKSLPNTITELFSFLIDEWTVEYGKMFTEDVCGLIALSKDGLLENQVNDILSFKEEREKGDNGFLYESSFSRIYDSLCSFLAAGGGGYLRFFHDQLKFTIRDKFLDKQFTSKTHELMTDFFMSVVRPQLCPNPQQKSPDYYSHVLNQVVYHQLQASQGESFDCLKDTLRNIYFVRERVIAGQQNLLNDDYLTAITMANNASDIRALKLWAKFVQLYAPNIIETPHFAHNMAVNQAPSSVVCKDSLALESPGKSDGYPLKWANIPEADDPMSVKIMTQGVDCVASTVQKDVLIVATKESASIYDQSSGEMLHKLGVSAHSVCLSGDEQQLLIGDAEGFIHCYDVDSGARTWTSDDNIGNSVTWIGIDGSDNILAGSGHARKAISWDDYSTEDFIMKLDGKTHDTAIKLSCGNPAWHYTYNKSSDQLFSTHKGFIAAWDMEKGVKLFEGNDGSRCIYCIDTHPSNNTVISGNNNLKVVEWTILESSLEILREIELPCLSGWAYGGVWSCKYSSDGNDVYCTEPQSQSIKIYDEKSCKVGELKGHPECINRINIIPGTHNEIISCDRGEISVVWNLPENKTDIDACKQEFDEKVLWCGFNNDDTFFITLTESVIRIWDSVQKKVVKSVDFSGYYGSVGSFHPDGSHVLIASKMNVSVYTTPDIELQADYEVLKTSDGSIKDLKTAKDGSKFIVAECKNSQSESSCAFMWNCQDPLNCSEKFIKSGYGNRMFSCDISDDGQLAVIGGHGNGIVIDTEKGETLKCIPYGCFVTAFVPGTRDFIVDGGNAFYLYNEDGEQKVSFFGHGAQVKDGCFRDNHIISSSADGTVKIWDLGTGECYYTFFNHRSQCMPSVDVNAAGDMVLAPNTNGMLYILTSE